MKKPIIQTLLFTCWAIASSWAESPAERSSDPTHLSPALQEALQAMRQTAPESSNRPSETLPVRLRGRIIQAERKAVILSIEDQFFALREGDTLSHDGQNLLLREIDSEFIVLHEMPSNRVLTLR